MRVRHASETSAIEDLNIFKIHTQNCVGNTVQTLVAPDQVDGALRTQRQSGRSSTRSALLAVPLKLTIGSE